MVIFTINLIKFKNLHELLHCFLCKFVYNKVQHFQQDTKYYKRLENAYTISETVLISYNNCKFVSAGHEGSGDGPIYKSVSLDKTQQLLRSSPASLATDTSGNTVYPTIA